MVAQFLFCFAMVVTFPYFIPYALARGAGHDALAGLLYSLPHLVYLVVLPWWRRGDGAAWLVPGLLVFALACAWQAFLDGTVAMAGARCCSGWACCSACVGSTAAWLPWPLARAPGVCSAASMPAANGPACWPASPPVR